MKKMKSVSVKNVMIMMIVLAMMIPSLALAEGEDIVEVGYEGVYSHEGKVYQPIIDHDNQTSTMGEYQYDLDELKLEFSVSNVVETFDASYIEYWLNPGIVVNSDSKITLLEDDLLIFEVDKLREVEENHYEYDYPLAVEGKYSVLVNKGEVDEDGNSKWSEEIIEMEEITSYEGEMYYHVAGNTVTLTEPGNYLVTARYEAAAGSAVAFIQVLADQPLVETEVEIEVEVELETEVTALPTDSKVLVNGENVSFNAYNINNNNYFKLRDLATVVSGSEKQFEVEWDQEVSAINLVSDESYTPVGGEMAQGDGLVKEGILNQSKIYLDGQEVQLTAYTIDDNNYFKLRDVAEVFDVGVTWDGQTQTIGIDTSIGYVAD